MKPGVWPWVTGAAALLALVSSVNSDMRGIQSNLKLASSSVIEQFTAKSAQSSDVRLSIDGRDVWLMGKIHTDAGRQEMVNALRAIPGVRIVRDDMQDFNPREQEKIDRLAFVQAIEQLDASSIAFEPGSSSLSDGSNLAIDRIADLLRASPQRQIKITGHTDNSGNAQINLKISRQRAQSVADALTAKGVSEEQLIVQGFGHTRPLYSNDTEAGRSRNRRIEFVFMK